MNSKMLLHMVQAYAPQDELVLISDIIEKENRIRELKMQQWREERELVKLATSEIQARRRAMTMPHRADQQLSSETEKLQRHYLGRPREVDAPSMECVAIDRNGK